MNRILLDCTHTYRSGARTGIQRVVRQFATYLPAHAQTLGYSVVPVRVDAVGSLVRLPLHQGAIVFPNSDSAREASPIVSATPALAMARLLIHALAKTLRSHTLSQWLVAGPNEAGLDRIYASITSKKSQHPDTVVDLSPSDIFLSLDSSWVYNIRSALDALGRAGVTRIALLCDILPITNPEWFSGGTPRVFRGWLNAISSRVEAFVGISATTCRAVQTYLASSAPMRQRPCHPVPLGADLASAPDLGKIRPKLKTLFHQPHAARFLTVGTLEPRKNVDFALDIFDQLAAQGCQAQWHIIGAEGWMAEKTIARISRHPALRSHLHWWPDLNDHELSYCYQHASALVAVSKAEGYGLPLVEARMHGIPVLCSDTPIFREIMGENAYYLPLASVQLATSIVLDFVTRGRLYPPLSGAAPTPVTSWHDAAQTLLNICMQIHSSRSI